MAGKPSAYFGGHFDSGSLKGFGFQVERLFDNVENPALAEAEHLSFGKDQNVGEHPFHPPNLTGDDSRILFFVAAVGRHACETLGKTADRHQRIAQFVGDGRGHFSEGGHLLAVDKSRLRFAQVLMGRLQTVQEHGILHRRSGMICKHFEKAPPVGRGGGLRPGVVDHQHAERTGMSDQGGAGKGSKPQRFDHLLEPGLSLRLRNEDDLGGASTSGERIILGVERKPLFHDFLAIRVISQLSAAFRR